jgi:hypothetical protein
VSNVTKLSSLLLTKRPNKLEYLSLADISSLVKYLRVRQEPTLEVLQLGRLSVLSPESLASGKRCSIFFMGFSDQEKKVL